MDMKEKIKGLEEEIKYKTIANEILLLKKKKVLEERQVESTGDFELVYQTADPDDDYIGYRLLKKKGEEVYALMLQLNHFLESFKTITADYTNPEDIKRLVELSKLKDDVDGKKDASDFIFWFGATIMVLSLFIGLISTQDSFYQGIWILLGGMSIGVFLIAVSKVLNVFRDISNNLK